MVSHVRTFYRPKSVYVGSEAFSGGATSAGAVARLGPSPIMRLPLDRWSSIEISPGVYDWGQSSLNKVVEAHRSGAEAVAPVLVAGAIPSFYSSNLANGATRSAAQAFAAAYAAHGVSLGGPFIVAVDPRVQETVFDALGADPNSWASLFVQTAAAIRTASPNMKVLPDVVGDGHSSYLPGAWLSTAMTAADMLGIEETAPLISTVLGDLDWFISGPAAGKKVWIAGSAFSTFPGPDARAHGTEADQAAYFGSLLTNVVVGYPSTVEAVIQTSLADEGTNSVWEDHLGVTTNSMASDKPAAAIFRTFVDNYPPYHPVFQNDHSQLVAQEVPFPLHYFSPTDFEYLDWSGVIDMSQVSAVNVDFQVSGPDGYAGYLLRAGNTWSRRTGGIADIKNSIGHGQVRLRFIVPTAVFNATATVQHLRVAPVIDTNLPDLFPPRIEGVSVSKKVTVIFTDDLDPASALVPANYQIRDLLSSPLAVYQVEPLGPRSVVLHTARQESRPYRLVVNGVKDTSGNIMSGAGADTVQFQGREFPRTTPPIHLPIEVRTQSGEPRGAWDISVDIPDEVGTGVDLEIFDVRGRRVATVVRDAGVTKGAATWTWNGRNDTGGNAAAGVYFVRARAGDAVGQARLTVLR